MLLLTSPELWAIARGSDLDLAPTLTAMGVNDRGEQFDEVAMLGLTCRGPVLADDDSNLILHPLTAAVLERLIGADDGFTSMIISETKIGARSIRRTVDGFISIERGATDVYGFQLIESEKELEYYVAEQMVSVLTLVDGDVRDIATARTGAADDALVAGLSVNLDRTLVTVQPSGESVDYNDADRLVSSTAAELARL